MCLIAGTLFIKACAKWLKLQDYDDTNSNSDLGNVLLHFFYYKTKKSKYLIEKLAYKLLYQYIGSYIIL